MSERRVSPRGLGAALALGLGAGLRSFAIPAVLGTHGRGPFPGPARFIAWGAAAGELIADKQPDTASRWAPRGLLLRVGFAASAGYDSPAGIDAAVLAGVAALAGARAGSMLRTRAAERPGRMALSAALAEDVLSYALVLAGACANR